MATPQELADRAMEALRGEDPMKAAQALQEALEADPERLDFLHALAVTELQLGDANSALALTFRGEQIARRRADQTAHTLFPQLLLARAAAFEDLHDPESAAAVFQGACGTSRRTRAPTSRSATSSWRGGAPRRASRCWTGTSPRQWTSLLSWRRPRPSPTPCAGSCGMRSFAGLLNAHRGSYVEFFDHHAERMEAEG